MEAQVLLKQFVVRRVGYGRNIDILNDPWSHILIFKQSMKG